MRRASWPETRCWSPPDQRDPAFAALRTACDLPLLVVRFDGQLVMWRTMVDSRAVDHPDRLGRLDQASAVAVAHRHVDDQMAVTSCWASAVPHSVAVLHGLMMPHHERMAHQHAPLMSFPLVPTLDRAALERSGSVLAASCPIGRRAPPGLRFGSVCPASFLAPHWPALNVTRRLAVGCVERDSLLARLPMDAGKIDSTAAMTASAGVVATMDSAGLWTAVTTDAAPLLE